MTQTSSFIKFLIGCITFAFFFFIWEIASHHYEHLRFVLSSPIKIFFTLWAHFDRFLFHTMMTFKEMVGGFLLALSISFPLAWMMVLYGPVRTVLQPFFVAIQCVPMFALAPIMVLWFGWSYIAIVIPTALMIFFPLTINLYQGFRSTPIALIEFFRLQGAGLWQIFFKLQLPWALPHVFAGLRITVAFAGIGAIAGEWAGAQAGLGLLMLESRRDVDIEMMFGAMACVTIMSLLLYGGAVALEKKIMQRRLGQTSRCIINSLLVSLILVCGGCQQDSGKTGETTLLLDWLPNPNHVPIYLGIDKGFFNEQGIALKILKIRDPADGIVYLTSKQVDLSLTYMPDTLKALSRGARLTPIGILIQEPLNAFIFRMNDGIAKSEDLNDRIVGYCICGAQAKALEATLAHRNIRPKEKYNVNFDLIGTLATKQVDAIYGAYWNIEIENLRSLGVETNYIPLTEFGVPTYYELIVLANQDGPYSTPEFQTAFKKALQKSIDYSIANPDEAFAIYLKNNPDKSQRVQVWERNAWYKTLAVYAKNQNIDPKVWNGYAEWLVAKQIIEAGKKPLLRLNSQ